MRSYRGRGAAAKEALNMGIAQRYCGCALSLTRECRACGRDPREVLLLPVSKTVGVPEVRPGHGGRRIRLRRKPTGLHCRKRRSVAAGALALYRKRAVPTDSRHRFPCVLGAFPVRRKTPGESRCGRCRAGQSAGCAAGSERFGGGEQIGPFPARRCRRLSVLRRACAGARARPYDHGPAGGTPKRRARRSRSFRR